MVVPVISQATVAVPAEPLTVMTGVGSVSVTISSDTAEALPLRTVTALMVTGELVLLERSMAPLYTVPVDAVGSVPSRV